ncbi:hypothetical protein [Oceanobacter mangrovi]|uniref:hypothetical protein n=1 Tax=Oceanobacter mangrovi TaxID=2862510 RepID=UPI001C8DB405|nr:hypothetical protein [Oceanobacter mangrovi]
MPSANADELYSDTKLVASSAAVSLRDMIHGWDGGFQDGEYAYADARQRLGVLVGDPQGSHWLLEWQRRWHYDLSFSKGMARYYRASETGEALQQDESLRLDIRAITATGLNFGKQFELTEQSLKLTPSVTVYRADSWQFGHLNGWAAAGSSGSASATLDYHFNEDKLLEYQVDPAAGWGLSFNLGVDWQIAEQWRLRGQIDDLWNLWRMEDSGYTDACINFDSPSQSVCTSSATASGKSGQEVFYGRLRPATEINLSWTPQLKGLQLGINLYHQGDYSRVGATVRQQLADSWSVHSGIYSSRQLGAGVGWKYLALDLKLDDYRMANVRDADFNLRLALPF